MGSVAKGFIGLTGILLGAVIIVFLVPRFLEKPEPNQIVSGIVAEVRMPNRADIVLVLRGDERTYLVDDGIADGRPFGEWGDALVERTVDIHVRRFRWSSDRPREQNVPVLAVYLDGELFHRVPN
jgi:hypothetical protein